MHMLKMTKFGPVHIPYAIMKHDQSTIFSEWRDGRGKRGLASPPFLCAFCCLRVNTALSIGLACRRRRWTAEVHACVFTLPIIPNDDDERGRRRENQRKKKTKKTRQKPTNNKMYTHTKLDAAKSHQTKDLDQHRKMWRKKKASQKIPLEQP